MMFFWFFMMKYQMCSQIQFIRISCRKMGTQESSPHSSPAQQLKMEAQQQKQVSPFAPLTPRMKLSQSKISNSRFTNDIANSILKMSLQNKIDNHVNSKLVQSRLRMLPVSQARFTKGETILEERQDYVKGLNAKFIGQIVNGKPHGFGKLYFQNDDYLQGTFVDGRCEGEGRIIKADGSYYEGQIKNNEADGHGKYYDVNGYKYEGQWKNNLPNGMGEASYPDGSRYVGQFLNNKRNGNGMYLINGDVFEGSFRNNKIDGFCIFTDKNGQKYEGQWSGGLKHGNGVYTWPDGKRYVGQYKNDHRQGLGTMHYSDNQKYVGQWENGQKHGEGLFENERQKMHGLWIKGKLQKMLP